MANPVNIAVDLQAEIEKRRTQSFLEQTTDFEIKKREEAERIAAPLIDYARRQQLADNIQGLIPSPGMSARKYLPQRQSLPGFNPASLAVVAPFMKRIRKQLKEAEKNSGKSYDLNTRKDPDTVEVPGITEKVKNARAKTYGDWNPETQQLHRMQYEDSPEFISYPSRGSIFTTPNRTPSDYRNTNGPQQGQEGGDKAVIHNQKFRNPLILRRDSGEYMADAGLDALFGADWSNNRHQLKSGTRVKTRREKIPIDGPATPISVTNEWDFNTGYTKPTVHKPSSLDYFLKKINKNKENPEYYAIYEDLMNTMLNNVMDNTKFKGDTLSAMVERVLPLAKSNISRVQNPQKDYKKYGGNADFYGTHERWLSEAARKAGYDGILGLRKKSGNLTSYPMSETFDGPANDPVSIKLAKKDMEKGIYTPAEMEKMFKKGDFNAGEYYGDGVRKKEPRYRAAQMMLLDPVDKIWNAWESAQERSRQDGKPKITNKIPNATITPASIKNYSPAEIEEKLNYYSSWAYPPHSTFSIKKYVDDQAVQQYFLEALKNRGIKPRSEITDKQREKNLKDAADMFKKAADEGWEVQLPNNPYDPDGWTAEGKKQDAIAEAAKKIKPTEYPSVKEMVKATKAAKAKNMEDYLNSPGPKPGENPTAFDKILDDFMKPTKNDTKVIDELLQQILGDQGKLPK